MLLERKVAAIYGAGGPIGGAVARAFAREGAIVFLAGRTKAKLDKVADEIRSGGGVANTAAVDALEERTVDEYVDAIVDQAEFGLGGSATVAEAVRALTAARCRCGP
jgi:3-oxoacyl-[acyl-carrier protein] reductase